MRKIQQRQILKLLESIREAQSSGLYADCQAGASSVGEFIEQIKGEGTLTVALLEEYCELLYRAHNGEIGERALNKQLIKIENSVKFELKPDKIEIAFISYKASMGDSLESIYLAAKSDPGCDAYWIPVPYYDRKPDGTKGTMYYESAGCYRETIDITDWREYDIEARRPDAIFTYSPYDAHNHITSIHPDYYCGRLCNLTDLLVYVPYTVFGDIPDKMHCITEGCVFAHKVILQSEKVREFFIEEYSRNYGSKYGIPQDKFVAIGSPKYDRVINSKREDFQMPEKWRALIGVKKAVLYNLSIAATLESDEQYLKKLRHVLETLRNRQDVVLWLRPHPLAKDTYQSMRPRLLYEYMQIITKYRNEGWGIYDDTADLHRAIAWTDAYYGDPSSIALLYQATGKPVMISDTNQHPGEINFAPIVHGVDETYIWFSIKQVNALFKMSRDSWEPQYVGSFPDEADFAPQFDSPMYQGSALNNAVMYFSSFQANEIAAYSVADNSFSKYSYLKPEDEKVHRLDFYGAVAYKEYVYFTPSMHPAIIRLNTETGEIDSYSDWLAPLKKMIGGVQDKFFPFPLVVENSIWLASCGANAVVEFDMDTQQFCVHEVGKKGYRYNGICFDGANFWLAPRDISKTPVVKWNPKIGVIKEFVDIHLEDKDQHGVSLIFFGNGYVYLLSNRSRKAYKIDVHSDTVSFAEELELDISDDEILLKKYTRARQFGDSIFLYNDTAKTFIEYNFATKERREEAVRYSPETLALIEPLLESAFHRDIEQIESGNECYYIESEVVKLPYFLNCLSGTAFEEQAGKISSRYREIFREINSDGKAGQAIYDYIKNAVC